MALNSLIVVGRLTGRPVRELVDGRRLFRASLILDEGDRRGELAVYGVEPGHIPVGYRVMLEGRLIRVKRRAPAIFVHSVELIEPIAPEQRPATVRRAEEPWDVDGHDRTLADGRVIKVRPHKRGLKRKSGPAK